MVRREGLTGGKRDAEVLVANNSLAAPLEGRRQHERRLGSGGRGERCVVAACSCRCRYTRKDGSCVGPLQANAQALVELSYSGALIQAGGLCSGARLNPENVLGSGPQPPRDSATTGAKVKPSSEQR